MRLLQLQHREEEAYGVALQPLQSSRQDIPVSDIQEWLGMEDVRRQIRQQVGSEVPFLPQAQRYRGAYILQADDPADSR